MESGSRSKKVLIRILMVAPPILLILYITQSFITIRGLLSNSSQFHVAFAQDLIQDDLSIKMALDIEKLQQCLEDDPQCQTVGWVSLAPQGQVLGELEMDGASYPYYLDYENMEATLQEFMSSRKGLSALFSTRFHLSDPVYWFRIINPSGRQVFQSGDEPGQASARSVYAMDRSFKGFEIEIIYNSFGARQLYSVSRKKINFGLIASLFLMAVFSAFLFTRSIRQKILLARQKTFFVTTISHEFKTPLAIMKLAAETLEAERFKSEKDKKKFLRMLTCEIDRLNLLVSKTLNFSRIEMGHIQYHHRKVDLHEILDATVIVFQTKAVAEGVNLKVDLTEKPCPIFGDKDLIRHAIDNILDNAFKYKGTSQEIEVSLTRGEKTVKLSVKDHGVGMAKDEIPHIMKSFYRVDDPHIRGIRGSGLGLSISTNILKRSKADLSIQSEPGVGSTFTITFPLAVEKSDSDHAV